MGQGHIKIFGERNTSTNALKRFVEMNSASRVLPSVAKEIDPASNARKARIRREKGGRKAIEAENDAVFEGRDIRHGWKHAAPLWQDPSPLLDCLTIFALRHPASWIFALHRRPYHHLQKPPPQLTDFINSGWRTVARERLGGRTFTPIALYEAKLRAYLALARQLDGLGASHITVKFEEFAVDQGAVFARLSPHLSHPAPDPRPLEASTKDPSRDAAFYRDYYGQNRWLKEIPSDALAEINAQCDWDLWSRVGYAPLTPNDQIFVKHATTPDPKAPKT